MKENNSTGDRKISDTACLVQRLISCGIYRPCKSDAVLYLQINFPAKTIRFGFWFKGKRNFGFARSDSKTKWWFHDGSAELDLWRFSYAKVPYVFGSSGQIDGRRS